MGKAPREVCVEVSSSRVRPARGAGAAALSPGPGLRSPWHTCSAGSRCGRAAQAARSGPCCRLCAVGEPGSPATGSTCGHRAALVCARPAPEGAERVCGGGSVQWDTWGVSCRSLRAVLRSLQDAAPFLQSSVPACEPGPAAQRGAVPAFAATMNLPLCPLCPSVLPWCERRFVAERQE